LVKLVDIAVVLPEPQSGRIKQHKDSPVGFITATKGHHSIPGSSAPASVRVERYLQPCLHDSIVKDGAGNALAPCIVHGDYVKVESLESDHIQAKANILQRQKGLVEKLNQDPPFAEFILREPGMNKFFIKHKGEYYGTLFFYELYFNDIDNIWLICDACNSKKSNEHTLDWLQNQWLYGQEFLDYLGKLDFVPKNQGVLEKIGTKNGLATVAIQWFWQRHANYISTAKDLYEKVTRPIQILNIKVDHVIGLGNQVRAERLQATLQAKLLLAAGLLTAKIDMPRGDGESSHSSSDDETKMTPVKVKNSQGQELQVTPNTYTKAARQASEKLPDVMRNLMKKELTEMMVAKSASTDQQNPLQMTDAKDKKSVNDLIGQFSSLS